jgi:hypothetical protein
VSAVVTSIQRIGALRALEGRIVAGTGRYLSSGAVARTRVGPCRSTAAMHRSSRRRSRSSSLASARLAAGLARPATVAAGAGDGGQTVGRPPQLSSGPARTGRPADLRGLRPAPAALPAALPPPPRPARRRRCRAHADTQAGRCRRRPARGRALPPAEPTEQEVVVDATNHSVALDGLRLLVLGWPTSRWPGHRSRQPTRARRPAADLRRGAG